MGDGLAVRRRAARLDERIQGAFEHFGDIPGGDLVTEQGLRVAQLVVGALTDRELQQEPLG